jgi:hypothetical protein
LKPEIIDMEKESKKLERDASRYRKKNGQKYVCPFCDSFLVPWSWDSSRDKEIVEQYTCKCNGSSPAWYVEVKRAWYREVRKQLFGNAIVEQLHSRIYEQFRVWSYINKHEGTWISNPSKVPKIFNPSVRQ